MSDVIKISGIELWTHLGVPASERAMEQRVLVSLELHTDTRKTATTDDVKKGIDYERVVEDVLKIGTKERKTLERLAEDIAFSILKNYKPMSVTVTITKFPIPGIAGTSLTIERP